MSATDDQLQLFLNRYLDTHYQSIIQQHYQSQGYNQMQNIQSLGQRLKLFEEELERSKVEREQAKVKRTEVLTQLQQDYQERNNSMISKMQELKRKQTLLITLRRIEPQIPEDFPKNFFCQLVYEDTLLTGSQKFTDFDQNVVEEKFVVPLLFSSIVKVQIWSAEEEPVLWAKTEINLQKDIEAALISQACEGELPLGKAGVSITYRLQLQGIGFSTWLRNIVEMRQLQSQKAYSRQQGAMKKQQMRARLQQKKKKFKQKFQREDKQSTNQYKAQTIDQILQELKDQ